MSLKSSYRLIAPFYDALLERASTQARRRSLVKLARQENRRVLISGAGTGLDFPFLPAQHEYTALDLTAAMLARSRDKAGHLRMAWVQGDSMDLPFADESFDCVVLHLITAVVPEPRRCLAETARVLRAGGQVLLFDKFLRRRQKAWLRRALNPVSARLATRLDVVLEDELMHVPQLHTLSDEPVLANGWFRLIELKKMMHEPR
jgi:phosphatidylethanolamine/phosphatidyl-N-methylethanolamine N-methyltransferase